MNGKFTSGTGAVKKVGADCRALYEIYKILFGGASPDCPYEQTAHAQASRHLC